MENKDYNPMVDCLERIEKKLNNISIILTLIEVAVAMLLGFKIGSIL